MSGLPLLTHGRAEAVVARRQGRPVTRARFLGDVAALAARLPDRRHVVNLCRDRYRFAVSLAAALVRGQLVLLPPNETPLMLAEIAADYPDLFLLADGPPPDTDLPQLAFPVELDGAPADEVPVIAAERPALVLFTSGSTGRPKPNVKTWGMLVASARAAGDRLGMARFPGATVLGTVPPQHLYGLESTLLLPLQHGLAFHAERPFYPADIVAALDEAPAPRVLVTTPIHLRVLLADGSTLPRADLVLSATAPLAPALAAEAEARFAGPLLEIYGCSEAGQIATRRPTEDAAWHCLDDISVRQDVRGSFVRVGEIAGEILLGDVLELLGPDRFLLHGRTADLVNIAGKRSSLAYLTAQLTSIPGVRDGLFVAPDEKEDGRLMAFAVAPGMTAEAVLSALRQRIDPAFLPRPLCLVEALPRNAVGKLPQEHLRALVSLATAS